MTHARDDDRSARRLIEVTLDHDTIGPGNRDIEHERSVAIYDLLEDKFYWSDGSFRVVLYAAPAEAKKLKTLGYKQEADPNFGKTLLERQQEVSKTDRFKGGKLKPTGLGVKR